MTYANEYRLGRRVYHRRREESLAFVLAVAAIIVLAAGYYILWARLHIRVGQLIELSLYAAYGLAATVFVAWYFATLEARAQLAAPSSMREPGEGPSRSRGGVQKERDRAGLQRTR
jgi:hypothetical protein